MLSNENLLHLPVTKCMVDDYYTTPVSTVSICIMYFPHITQPDSC